MTQVDAAAPVAGVAPAPPLWAPLRHRDFRLLWLGGNAAVVGDQFTFVALAWLALQLTGSPATLGVVLTIAAVPRAAFVLIGGVVADRLSARRVAILAALSRACVVALLTALVLTHHIGLPVLCVLAFGFGLADAFYAPSRGALLPLTVSLDELEAANSLTQTGQSAAVLVGPAIGGVVVAAFGTGYGFLADAACFTLVAIATLMLRARSPVAPAPDEQTTMWRELRMGLRHVFADPVLRALVLITAAVNAATIGPIEVGLAYVARLHLGGAAALGAVLAGFAAGSIAGSLASGILGRRRLAPLILVVCVALGAGLPLLAYVPNLALAFIDTLVMGGLGGFISVAAVATVQRRIAPGFMGRVMSVFVLASVGMGPISLAVAGFVAGASIVALFAASGGLALAAGVGGLAFRDVRRL